ncbi:MAG TPA: hypothetical protein VHP11_09455 [Tepidisphaeraceae bacterium]|nr:hypothetical protein [Tepidisphaeraceae bacterium]
MSNQPPPVPDDLKGLLPEPGAPGEIPEPVAPAVPVSFWQLPFAQNILPMLTSVALHVTVIVIAILTVKAVQAVMHNPVHEQIIIPDAEIVTEGTPGGVPHPGLGGDPTRDAAQDQIPDVPKDSTGVASKPGLTALPDMMGGPGNNEGPMVVGIGPGMVGSGGTGTGVGSGTGGGQLAPFGPVGGGGGIGPKTNFLGSGGNARRVVFVCDASGSMTGIFDDLRVQLRMSVDKLQPIQSFNVIFFREQAFIAVDKSNLLMGTPDNKRKAFQFLDQMFTRSSSNPIPALDLAFSFKPDLIYLLTDGDFEGLAGEVTNEQVIRYCQQKTAEGKPKINTLAFIPKDARGEPLNKEFVKALQAIAKNSGGVFKHVSEDDIGMRR